MTEDDFIRYLRDVFPLFTDDAIEKVLRYYPSTNAAVDDGISDFATSGTSGATALDQSTFASGQQQRANVSGPCYVSVRISSFSSKPYISDPVLNFQF